MKTEFLRQLGVYGYAPVEPVILAALASVKGAPKVQRVPVQK